MIPHRRVVSESSVQTKQATGVRRINGSLKFMARLHAASSGGWKPDAGVALGTPVLPLGSRYPSGEQPPARGGGLCALARPGRRRGQGRGTLRSPFSDGRRNPPTAALARLPSPGSDTAIRRVPTQVEHHREDRAATPVNTRNRAGQNGKGDSMSPERPAPEGIH